MTVRPPGPYLLDIPYVQTGQVHHLTLNCDVVGPADVGISPTVVTMRSKGSGPLILAGAADDLWALVRELLATTCIASTYVLWKYNGTNLDKTFISGGSLTLPNGTQPVAAVLASQIIMTYRSGAGNIGRLNVNDIVYASNVRQPLGTLNAATAAIRSYLLSNDCIVMARDRSFPVAALNESLGQNEKLWKRRYRS